jgi:hypothetical protein
MARFQIPRQAYIQNDDQNYGQAFNAIAQAIDNISDQGNFDPNGAVLPTPTPPTAISVMAKDGIHDIQIQDNSPAYNGIRYRARYSRTPDFANSHVIDMGESQNHRANLGAGQYYWQASSKYPSSLESSPVYHGGLQPTPVGNGSHVGPPMQAGQGFSGIYRNSPIPPVRK